MSVIQVKFDHTLQQSEIAVPLIHSSQQEAGEAYTTNQSERQQTLVYGIHAPLIMINQIVVNFLDVTSFELLCENQLPEVHMIVQDRYKLTTLLDSPGIDNELRVQILPRFEDKYKKINLTFYITQMKNNNGEIHITGEYKAPKFVSSNIKSFGETSIYKLFENVAQETQLGFATNIEDNNLKRYIYCDNKSYKDLLRNEIMRSCTEMEIYEYWIDWWNNLILADIYERYNATDKDEDMQVWVSSQNKEVEEGSEIEPMQVVASFTNIPPARSTELFVLDYRNCTSPGQQMFSGTDRVFSVYEFNKVEYKDYLVQDGDVKKDIFTKYEYLGEAYGEHNYLLAYKKYDTFKQKIKSNETIEIILETPLLGIMRGNKVNFLWYTNDTSVSVMKDNLKETDLLSNNPETNINLNADGSIEESGYDGNYELDKSISGQYLVTKCSMKFRDSKWQYVVTLSRPSSMKPQILKEEENK